MQVHQNVSSKRANIRLSSRNAPQLPLRISMVPKRHSLVKAASSDPDGTIQQPITPPAPLKAPPPPPSPAELTTQSLLSSANWLKGINALAFWSQLGLTLVSSGVLVFSILISLTGNIQGLALDVSKYFALSGLLLSWVSTFFAFTFLQLSRRLVAGDAKGLHASGLLASLLRNTTINLLGIGLTTIGLQASVGTLVGKTFLQAAQAPFQYSSGNPGAALVSLDVFALQASTNILLCHLLGLTFANMSIRVVNSSLKQANAA